jgi:GntR family transcriptional regulator / MocR family aminotransferase
VLRVRITEGLKGSRESNAQQTGYAPWQPSGVQRAGLPRTISLTTSFRFTYSIGMLLLDQNNPMQLYVQLYEQIKAQVLLGKLPSHTKLPSVRDLAIVLSTSRSTIENAYQELLAEGYIYTKPRSGFFVSHLDPEFGALTPTPRERPFTRLKDSSSSFKYDFHPARLGAESFPAATWRKLLTECLHEHSLQYGQYRDPQGEWRLRCGIRDYLERSRGVICDPEHVVICSGLQQSLDIVAQIIGLRPKRVAVEDPGYFLPRKVFSNHSFEVVPIRVGMGGLDLEQVTSSNCSAIYVTPSHQFPAGHVMPIATRLNLLIWSEKSGGIILEDDYDSELRYHGKPIPALQGLHPQGNVVYMGSVSKVLSPALRISYLVLPPALLDRYQMIFRGYFSTVSLLEQQTLASFMEQGYWDRHLRRIRTTYKKKHDALLVAIERHFGERAKVTGQGAGLHVVIGLADQPYPEKELIQRAVAKGIFLSPFSESYASGSSDSNNVMLGFGGMNPEQLEQGIEQLYQAWYSSPR